MIVDVSVVIVAILTIVVLRPSRFKKPQQMLITSNYDTQSAGVKSKGTSCSVSGRAAW